MRLRRQPASFSLPRSCGCALLLPLLLVATLYAALPLLPDFVPELILRVSGFQAIAATAIPEPAVDAPALTDVVGVAGVAYDLGEYGALTLPRNAARSVVMGRDARGQQSLQVSLSGDDLADLCRAYSDYCGDNGASIRRVNFDLRQGGLRVAGELRIPLLNKWLAFELHPAFPGGAAIAIGGITIGGQRYALPEHSLGASFLGMLSQANQALQQLYAAYDGRGYKLAALDIREDRLVATFRSG